MINSNDNIFRTADPKNYPSLKYKALKITSSILNLIELINAAFGAQIFSTIFVLLLFGIIMAYAFKSTTGITIFPTTRLVTILIYVHYVLLEISHYGAAIHNEV